MSEKLGGHIPEFGYQEGTIVPMIDLEISGECNLHCPTCWGTPPSMRQEHDLSDWLTLLKNLKQTTAWRVLP